MKNKSSKQEHSWAEKVGGNVTIGSGCLWFQKSDVNAPGWKFELKTTEKKYYNLKLDDLEFCVKAAYRSHNKPGFVIRFDDENNDENVVIVPISDCEIEIDLSELKVLLIKNKQIKLKFTEVYNKILLLKSKRKKYLIFPEGFFLENLM